jgi:glycerol-3-phosphate cytidylyltransferase
MTYCFDLDETICYSSSSGPRDYSLAQPYPPVVDQINKLYKEGHTITIFTARGGTSGKDWHGVTLAQLKSWSLKYHTLIDKGKPHFDLFIDDKAINTQDWRKKNNSKITGFVASTFDLLHAGHCLYLKDAKRICDYLIAGLQTNPTLDRPEKNKPIQTINERQIQLEACKYVDEIVEYSSEEDLNNILKKIKPDIRILGTDCKARRWMTGREYCSQIYYHSRNHNWSSTELIKRIKKS